MKKERLENRYSMKAIVPIIEEYTSRSKEVIFTAKGNSMRPLLRNGKDQLILRGYNGEELPMGTVVLYQRADMSFSAHRIVGKNDKGFVMMGDFQTIREEGIMPSSIKAVVVGFIKNGREFSVQNKRYLCYVRFWMKSKVIRKSYIFTVSKFIAIKRRLPK